MMSVDFIFAPSIEIKAAVEQFHTATLFPYNGGANQRGVAQDGVVAKDFAVHSDS